MFDIENINDPLEPLKVEQALRSEMMKLEYWKKNMPSEINILDYTVIKALEFVLNEGEYRIKKKPETIVNENDVQIGRITFKKGTTVYKCPTCDRLIIYGEKFCRDCGQAILWEG